MSIRKLKTIKSTGKAELPLGPYFPLRHANHISAGSGEPLHIRSSNRRAAARPYRSLGFKEIQKLKIIRIVQLGNGIPGH